MKFLNGFKSALGLIGALATPLVALGGNVGKLASDGIAALPHIATAVEGGFLTLLALGIVHKVEKAKASKTSF